MMFLYLLLSGGVLYGGYRIGQWHHGRVKTAKALAAAVEVKETTSADIDAKFQAAVKEGLISKADLIELNLEDQEPSG